MDHVSSLIPTVLRTRGLSDEAYVSMTIYRARKKWRNGLAALLFHANMQRTR